MRFGASVRESAPVTEEHDVGERAIVRGRSVWLRAFERDDLDDYWRCINDREVAFWAGYGNPQSHDGVLDWYENSVREGHGKTGLWFVVSPLGGSEFLGTTWLWNRDARLHGPNSAELSVYIGDPRRWGTGVGTDAVNATVDAGFGFWPLAKIWLSTSADNDRAQRAFEKAGFVLDGRLRRTHLSRGQIGDSLVMSMLREEWEALQRTRAWDWGKDGAD